MNDLFIPPIPANSASAIRTSANPSSGPPKGVHVAIIGGGASGVLMAVHLLRQPFTARVTLIERSGAMGTGVAYSTIDPEHLLNTRLHNMSGFPEDPQHFHAWLQRHQDTTVNDQGFVSRATYGRYLGALLAEWDADSRLTRIYQDVTDLTETASGVTLHLADRNTLQADRAVLATGHVIPDQAREWPLTDGWTPQEPPPPQSRIIIIGSGLSMVDQVLTILRSGHTGPILSLSRRGLLPRDHTATKPMQLDSKHLPRAASASTLLAWARGRARAAVAQGGTWRDAVDGIRPHVATLWRGLPVPERARFLRHAATWWDVHRHRITPGSQTALHQAILDGQLTIRKTVSQDAVVRPEGGLFAYIRPYGSTQSDAISASRIIDCRGIRRDPELNATPLVQSLLAQKAARIDPLRIGLEVDAHCRLIAHDGGVSPRIHVVGPASRAAFWEITAIPDIREQVARLAVEIAVI